MPEWIAIVLTIALIALVVWIVLTVAIGALYGDIAEGAAAATGTVIILLLIAGVIFGAAALVGWIWAGVS